MFVRRMLLLVAVFSCVFLRAETEKAGTPPYDAVYVFGDSFCDVGNVSIASGGTVPAPPYFHGRFSNGPIWVEHVAGAWGLPMKPSLLGGTDYAFGGAQVTVTAGGIPSVVAQVGLYLSQHGGKADPHALYLIEGGSNDIFARLLSGSPETLGHDIALGLVKSATLLREAGAKNLLIPSLLDVGLAPKLSSFPQEVAAFATAATVAVNKDLKRLLESEGDSDGVHIYRVDLFAVIRAIVADATHFGFTDITHPCLDTMAKTVCADPDHTLFWDTVHPTEFGHAFAAVAVESVLSPLSRGEED